LNHRSRAQAFWRGIFFAHGSSQPLFRQLKRTDDPTSGIAHNRSCNVSKESSNEKPMSLDVAVAILGPIVKYNPQMKKLPELAQAWRVITERLDASADPLRLVITMDGGLIHNIQTDSAAHIIVVDEDTEGSAPEDLSQLDGVEVHVAHWCVGDESSAVDDVFSQLGPADGGKPAGAGTPQTSLSGRVDPLTIAYMAIGAYSALREFQAKHASANLDKFEGELGYIGKVTQHANLLDDLAGTADLSGVFAYEVAQPFGEEFGRGLLGCEASIDARNIAERLIKECSA
jgi:hypothetical protein